MTAREKANEYRLARWAQIIHERSESGLSVRKYCEEIGVHANTYYRWQNKLRKESLKSISPDKQAEATVPALPEGWALCNAEEKATLANRMKTLPIEIGVCRVMVDSEVDPELLTRVCRVLVSLC